MCFGSVPMAIGALFCAFEYGLNFLVLAFVEALTFYLLFDLCYNKLQVCLQEVGHVCC